MPDRACLRPLAVQVTSANRHDSQCALALVDAIPFLQGERGRPRHCPDSVVGDRGYDAESIRLGLRLREYALLMVLIALVAIASMKTLGTTVSNVFSNAAANLTTAT